MRIECYLTDRKQDWEKFTFRGPKGLIKFLTEGVDFKDLETITIQLHHPEERTEK